jgi:ABC-type molybdate transport system substrate-binding protein
MRLRRDLMRSLLAMPLLMAAGLAPSGPEVVATDLALSCEPTIAPALAAVAQAYRAQSGVRVHVHPTAAHLLLPQLRREIQNDIVVAGSDLMQQAAAEGLVPQPDAAPVWRNRLVLVARRASRAQPGSQPLAIPDAWPGSTLDGAALLAALGLHPDAIIGAANTQEIAFLVLSGAAQTGIVYLTDLRAEAGLEALVQVDDAATPPILYRAGISSLARRGSPGRFTAFLAQPASAALMAAAGLEVQS